MKLFEKVNHFLFPTKHEFPECFDDHKCVFIHIPKTAGISLSEALYRQVVGHWKLADLKKTHGSNLNDYFVFTVVRHPVDRFVSTYNFLKCGGINEKDRIRQKTILEYDSINDFTKNWFYKNGFSNWTHLLPQHVFLNKSGKVGDHRISINHIGKFHQINRTVRILEEQFDLYLNMPKKNLTTYTETFLEPEAKSIVERKYSLDFELFDYE